MQGPHDPERLPQRQGRVSLHAVAGGPASEPEPRQVLAQLRQRLPERGVPEERLLERLQLAALGRRERVEQRLELGGVAGEPLEQLVQAADPGEHRPPAGEEPAGVGPAARRRPLAEEPVQVAQHRAQRRDVLRPEPLQSLLEPAEEALGDLLPEPHHQGLELLPRLGIHERVVLERADRAAEIGRERVEPLPALRRRARERLPGPGRVRPGRRGGGEAALDPGPLGRHHVPELLAQLGQHVAELMLAQERLALPAEALQQLAEPGHRLAGARAEPAAEQALERPARVAVRHQVVGHRGEHVVGVRVGDRLGPVPARVADQHVDPRITPGTGDRRARGPC